MKNIVALEDSVAIRSIELKERKKHLNIAPWFFGRHSSKLTSFKQISIPLEMHKTKCHRVTECKCDRRKNIRAFICVYHSKLSAGGMAWTSKCRLLCLNYPCRGCRSQPPLVWRQILSDGPQAKISIWYLFNAFGFPE